MSKQCSKRVYSGARWDFGGHLCGTPATLQTPDGKWWCKRHHPDNTAAKAAADRAKADAEREAERAVVDRTDTVLDRLRKAVGVSVGYASQSPLALVNRKFGPATGAWFTANELEYLAELLEHRGS